METVLSRDGTTIAFQRSGAGPPLVLVHGSTADHHRWDTVLADLTPHFTVYAMDRRGRGASGDRPAYRLDDEFDDVAAVLEATGQRSALLGHSFGALCAMEAALRSGRVSRLVLYEPAFPAGAGEIYPPDARERYQALVEAGDRETLLTEFFRDVAGLSDAAIAAFRADPTWPGRLAAAHTAIREMAEADYVFDPARFRRLEVPTLLLLGGESPAILQAPTRALAAALPDARVAVMPGQGHAAMNTGRELFLELVLGFLRG